MFFWSWFSIHFGDNIDLSNLFEQKKNAERRKLFASEQLIE